MDPIQVSVGQEVSLNLDNPDWLRVERAEGRRVCLQRSLGDPSASDERFWTDAELIQAARWPATGGGL